MPTTRRGSGLRITYPETHRVLDIVTPDAGRRKTRTFAPIPLPTDPAAALANEAIIEALQDQDMQLVDKVELTPGGPGAGARRGAGIALERAAEIEVDVAPQEDAVVLLEQDGMYSWKFAAESGIAPAQPIARGVRQAPAQRLVRFRIEMPTAAAPGPARRGIVTDFLADKVKVYVLKFAAHVAVGQAVKFLERNIRRGIVKIASLDVEQWTLIDNLSSLNLPSDRPARILLLVHGTFSSTVGGYGALTGTPWGQKFLQGAWANYDAVIGFDHATLSDDPLGNASDLLQRLESFDWKFAPHFDAVAHSRGGLVFRSLVEQLLPLSKLPARFDRAVFTACTNAGTLLAEPDNWNALVDLYTNLAVAACRLLGTLPQAKAVTITLKEAIQGLGVFIKYCATAVVTDGEAPGLAAMEPKGEFIKTINQTQEGQPTIEKSYYCAITSEFEPRILNGDHEPKELPRRFVQWIADTFADQLMSEANDLVVNTASMTAIDPQAGNFIKDRLEFGKNPQVYHTNYFLQPQVVNALTNWLQLVEPVAAAAVREPRAAMRSTPQARKPAAAKTPPKFPPKWPPKLPPVRAATKKSSVIARGGVVVRIPTSGKLVTPVGAVVGVRLAGTVDKDIIVATADTSVKDCLKWIKESAPSYVVVRRDYGGETLDYAFGAEEIISNTERSRSADSLMTALNLHETDRSPSRSAIDQLTPLEYKSGPKTNRRIVVLDRGQPLGVLPATTGPASGAEMVELARMVSRPRGDVNRIRMTRAMPTFSAPDFSVETGAASRGKTRASAIRPARPEAPPKITCHFHAEMESEVVVKRAASVEVLVSREVIERLTGPAAVQAKAPVDPSKKLLIQVFTKKNFEMVGEDRAEIDPPAPNAPQSLIFDVRPTHEGEGEIWVIARQGQVPLITLVLKPQIVKAKSGETRRVSADATAAGAPVLREPLNQLFIREQNNGDEVSYSFEFQSPGLKLLEWDSSKKFEGDRQKYVEGLYKNIEQRWLGNKDDVQAFADEMREFGGQLLDELFPQKLQQILWDHRKQIKSIMVISDEPFIPWELVHLKEPGKSLPAGETIFLGQMGLVRWLHEAGWPPDRLRIKKGRARYVIPQYPDPGYVLPEAQKEADFLKRKFSATDVEASSTAVRNLLRLPGAFDLLHFACHGHAEQDNISNAGLLMTGRMENRRYIEDFLTATTAEQSSNLKADDGNFPTIVLNACQAARVGYQLTGVGGFAQAFLKRGAGAFVGTLWSVGDSPARTFTESFYESLIKKSTFADAAITAREAARQAGDATWLAYVVYGHPQAIVAGG